MSLANIRAALESALNGMSPPLSTNWENTPFIPVQSTPYQRVNLLLAQPNDDEFGPHHVEQGYLQITLCYPIGVGPAAAAARADLLRTTFARGLSFTSGGVVVNIFKTPEVTPGQIDEDRYVVPVKIRFSAEV